MKCYVGDSKEKGRFFAMEFFGNENIESINQNIDEVKKILIKNNKNGFLFILYCKYENFDFLKEKLKIEKVI